MTDDRSKKWHKVDLVSVGFINHSYAVSLRIYADKNWGKRVLGRGRFALDFGRLSLVLENYNKR